MIYDEESDRHIHIPFEQAMKATGYGAAGGPTGDIFKLTGVSAADVAKADAHATTTEKFGGGRVGTHDKTFAAIVEQAKELDDSHEKCKDIAEALEKFVAAGCWCPVEIVIARPFIEHLMLSAVVTVAGKDTGATLFGPADMQISANTSVKTIEGYDCLFKLTHTHTHTFYPFQYRGTGPC